MTLQAVFCHNSCLMKLGLSLSHYVSCVLPLLKLLYSEAAAEITLFSVPGLNASTGPTLIDRVKLVYSRNLPDSSSFLLF